MPAEGRLQPAAQPAPAPEAGPGPSPTLPETLESPATQKGLNPAAASFSPTKGRAARAAGAQAQPAAACSGGSGGAVPPVAMPPVIHSIFNSIEAALAGRSFVPAWDRLQAECAAHPGRPLVTAEAVEYESGTEDEGDCPPDPREVFAAVASCNLNACFVTRSLMRRLAHVEVLLKATVVGDPGAAPSVLVGAVVRVLIDKAYKLRQVQSTFIKPESGRLMLVLHDVNSPIPADHISNTNPLLPGAPPGNAAEGEVLELAAKLAFHGRRLFRHEVAATAWRLQFAEYWAKEQGAKTGDELRLAAAQLRAMLGDEDEIKWRRRGVIGLDLAQEAAAVAAAFRLPWNAAASWMAQQGPELAPAACPPGGTPGSSDVTGEYQTRPPVSEVLGPQHDDACRAPGGAACRSLLRGAADPRQHARYMAAAYRGCNPAQQECEPAAQQAARPGGQLASHGAHPSGAAAASDSSSAGSSATGASEAASLDGGDAAELAEEEERLLAEASSTFSGAALPEYFPPGLAGQGPRPPAAFPNPHKHGPGGAENSDSQARSAAGSMARVAGKVAAVAQVAASLERAGSGRIAALHTRQ